MAQRWRPGHKERGQAHRALARACAGARRAVRRRQVRSTRRAAAAVLAPARIRARARACEMGVHWRERPGQPEHGYRRGSGRERPAKRVGRTKRVRMSVARDAHVHGEVCVRSLRLPSEPGGVCGGAKPTDAVVNARVCGLYRFTCLPGGLALSHACTASDSDEHRRNGVGSATAPRGPASQRR
jgi:hypothetical protein